MIEKIDSSIIHIVRTHSVTVARIAIGAIYIWFGWLKVIGLSPANPLVEALLSHTMPFLSFSAFIALFGAFEVLIGIAFLVPRLERLAIALLLLHLITTLGPLVVLPRVTWTAPLVPTLEGQYIIKNLAIVASACAIIAHMRPMKNKTLRDQS